MNQLQKLFSRCMQLLSQGMDQFYGAIGVVLGEAGERFRR